MKKVFLAAALLAFWGLAAAPAQAQAPGSTGPTPGAPQADPTAVPLDGGASLLLISGVAYGLKRLRDQRRKR